MVGLEGTNGGCEVRVVELDLSYCRWMEWGATASEQETTSDSLIREKLEGGVGGGTLRGYGSRGGVNGGVARRVEWEVAGMRVLRKVSPTFLLGDNEGGDGRRGSVVDGEVTRVIVGGLRRDRFLHTFLPNRTGWRPAISDVGAVGNEKIETLGWEHCFGFSSMTSDLVNRSHKESMSIGGDGGMLGTIVGVRNHTKVESLCVGRSGGG